MNDIKTKILGKTNKEISICGYGSYRVNQGIVPHYESLKYALKNGINLIDTSTNYSDGGSEELIGNLTTELIGQDKKREDFVIVSKAGYIQGQNLELVKSKENTDEKYEDIVVCDQNMWHCIHPDFLRDEITNSLERLNTNYIDVYLLHNPEYFLISSAETDLDKLREEYYKRIKLAFDYLEHEVDEGRIHYYGISSNTFGNNSDSRTFTSLEEVLKISESPSHPHFGVIQLPLNIIEKNCYTNKNQFENTLSVIELANKNNLGILVNRPLNAIDGQVVTRLADYAVNENRNEKELVDLIESLKPFEENFKHNYLSDFEEYEKKELNNYFSLSQFLLSNYNKFENITHFRDAKVSYFNPRINLALNALYQKNPDNEKITKELNEYAVYLNIIWETIDSFYAEKSNQTNKKYHELIDGFLNEETKECSLSQKAILIINSLNSVSATLVGMRNITYVNDVLGSMNMDYVEHVDKFWEK